MEMSFEEKLKYGNIAEKEVSEILISKGCSVIKSYNYINNEDDIKSPRLFSKYNNLILPDLDVSINGFRIWVECKHYTDTPFNRTYKIYVHGIKKRLYEQYLQVQKITGADVYLYIKEEKYNKIIYSKLDVLKTYKCLFRHEHNKNCLVYFNRDDFNECLTNNN